jgi:hypothetical protein
MKRAAPAVAALVAIALAAPAAPGRESDPRLQLTVSSEGHRVHATAGSACLSESHPDGTSSTICRDVAYPLRTHGRVPVHGRGRVILRFGAAPAEVFARLIGAGRERLIASPRPDASGSRRWVLRLPGRVRGATTLDVFVRYPNRDDASFEAGVRPRARRS